MAEHPKKSAESVNPVSDFKYKKNAAMSYSFLGGKQKINHIGRIGLKSSLISHKIIPK